ncbi:MAG: hypothetical protein ACR2II_10785 [Chthoniobacterales bacterium]
MAEEIFSPLTRFPAINNIAQRVVQSVREAEGLDDAIDAFVVIHAHAVSAASHLHRGIGVRVRLHVKKFGAESPMRIFGGKAKRPRSVIRWIVEVTAFKWNVAKSQIGSAALLQAQIAVLAQCDAGKNRQLCFCVSFAGESRQETQEQKQHSIAGCETKSLFCEARSNHHGTVR